MNLYIPTVFKYCVKFLLMLVIFLFCNIGCNVDHNKNNVGETMGQDTSWKKLSLREKIGQVICLNYNYSQIINAGNGSIENFLKKYPVGSFFLANWELSKNTTKDSLKFKYIEAVTKLTEESKYPLLLVEDFECGLGSSITDYSHLPGEMGLGATNSSELAYTYGEIVAREARSIGINWLLHPVSDLNLNPFNFITNVRAVGDNPNRAIDLLESQVQGMQEQKVAATAKHFPGDGTDLIDQHFTTSKMMLNYDDWLKQHGRVFQSLIDNGVMSIMPGHISFPDYQKEMVSGEKLPATLSREIMTELLKEKMGFDGVVVSDALNMGGIAGYYENQIETEIECFKAGADILIWPQLATIDTIEARIKSGKISTDRLDDAVHRVWNLKKKLGLFESNYEYIRQLTQEEIEKHKKKSYEISKRSITQISNKNNLIPLDPQLSKNLLLVVISVDDNLETFEPLKEKLQNFGFVTSIQQNLSFFENASNLELIVKEYDKIIFLFYSKPVVPWGSLSLSGDQALTMWSANMMPYDKIISVSFGDPYKNLIYMPRVWSRINCYNADKNSQTALAEALVGKFKMSGVSPVDYPAN